MPPEIGKTLDQIRTELVASFSSADLAAYRNLVDWLRDNDVASHALKAGDTAPDFLLPDADGRLHSSEQLRRQGPLVVSFFRGGWCPFCTAELHALQAAKGDFDALGARLVVLTPETGAFPRLLKRSLDLDLDVLSDVDYGVAASYGILFRVPEETKAHYTQKGFDLGARHGSSVWMLPIPATYVIDSAGRTVSAFVKHDFTIRQEPKATIAALRAAAMES
jgi:peroxiredoxin